MKFRFCAVIGYQGRAYSSLDVIATCEEEARLIIELHLAHKKALGFSEREMRKPNPKRTPWQPGLELLYFIGSNPVDDSRKVGVVLENEDEEDLGIPF